MDLKRNAKKLIEKILSAIRETTYLKSESQPVKITASFGIAMYPADAGTIKDLLILADKTMYRVKTAPIAFPTTIKNVIVRLILFFRFVIDI